MLLVNCYSPPQLKFWNANYKNDLIHRVAILHDSLVDGVNMINKCYSLQACHFPRSVKMQQLIAHMFPIHFQIMMYVGSCFAYLIVCLYGIYLKITDKSISADMVSLEALWALYYIGCVVMIIAVASLTTREVYWLSSVF